jgi:hypothetical protein
MPGIYIAAILTIALSLGVLGLTIVKRIPPSERLLAALGVIGGAAVFFGAFYLLRIPLNNLFQSLMKGYPAWYYFGSTFYAPLTEEPAKWILLVPLFLAGKINRENKGAWAICLGFGFGMGEIMFLARGIASDPQTLSLAWYQSSGFIVERLMVCFIHSALILIAAEALIHKKLWGMVLALVFHWLLNFPIYLSYQYPLDAARNVWGQLLWTWNTLFFVGAMIYLGQSLLTPEQRIAAFLGKAVCPECQTLYVRPWWGINRIGKRYERCPQCKHYHWTTLYVEKSIQ